MKSFLLALAIIGFASLNLFGQSAIPKPSATPPSEENDVVKISTSLIQIDVSVTDSKGKIVTDLKPDEIEIYENGEKQKITNFSFISRPQPVTEEKKAAADKPAVPVPQAELRAEKIRRTIALVVDDLSLSFESTYQVRRALKKFVDEQMQDGDLVAIIRTGAGIGALQQFTSDKRMLYAAIERVRWNPLGSGNIGAFAPLEAKLPTAVPTPSPEAGERTQEGIERENREFRAGVFATGTLGAVSYIVRGMQELPGRKSIMLLSDGFKLFTKDADGTVDSSRIRDSLRRLIDQANRASVVIYAIDPRGLQTLSLTAEDNTTGRSAEEVAQAMSERGDDLRDTQDGLVYLARQTGGFAIINNNDISGGIRRVLEDQSYYLVGYEPAGDTFDPKTRRFNKLDVKVMRPGTSVRYRSGFFNVANRPSTPLTAAAESPLQQLTTALTSPFAVQGISLRLNALFGNDPARGSYVRTLLHVDAKDLKFTDQPDGTKKLVFTVMTASFGDNGQPVDQLAKEYTVNIQPAGYKKILSDGFVYHVSFPIKKPGAYQYRVAVRDSQGGAVGSASQFIEIPNLKKNRLTLSSIVLENLSADQEKQIADPMSDTALRRTKLGSILRYGYEIYNVKLDPSKKPNLTAKIRVFREGKLLLDGQQIPLDLQGQTNMQRINAAGAISIGEKMVPDDYILQIIVTDNLANAKNNISTQYVQFEVVE